MIGRQKGGGEESRNDKGERSVLSIAGDRNTLGRSRLSNMGKKVTKKR